MPGLLLALGAVAGLLLLATHKPAAPPRRSVTGKSGAQWFVETQKATVPGTVRFGVFDSASPSANMVLRYMQVLDALGGRQVGERFVEFQAPSTSGQRAAADFGPFT